VELTAFHVPIIPRWPFYLILNTAVSPFGLPDALECDYDLYHYVDYVRVGASNCFPPHHPTHSDLFHYMACYDMARAMFGGAYVNPEP